MASKLQGNGSLGLGESSGAATPQVMKQHRHLFFGGRNRGDSLLWSLPIYTSFISKSGWQFCLAQEKQWLPMGFSQPPERAIRRTLHPQQSSCLRSQPPAQKTSPSTTSLQRSNSCFLTQNSAALLRCLCSATKPCFPTGTRLWVLHRTGMVQAHPL